MDNYNFIIKDTLSKLSDMPVESIENSLFIREDLKLDSLSSIELIYELEERLGIKINEEDIFQIMTVGNLIDFIAKELKK